MLQEHCTITQLEEGVHAESSQFVLDVIPDAGDEARAFNRNGIRLLRKTGEEERVRWLVGELDGVRVYATVEQDGRVHMVMTKRDFYP